MEGGNRSGREGCKHSTARALPQTATDGRQRIPARDREFADKKCRSSSIRTQISSPPLLEAPTSASDMVTNKPCLVFPFPESAIPGKLRMRLPPPSATKASSRARIPTADPPRQNRSREEGKERRGACKVRIQQGWQAR